MKLYLMQHGKAMSKEENPDRPLTQEGKDDVGRVAQCLAQAGIRISEIRQSGKTRAEETARIVAQHLQIEENVFAIKGISPNDDVVPIAEDLETLSDPVMLVGHLPFLSRLVSYLMTKNTEQPIVQFQMGGVVCLGKQDERWVLEWMIVPDMVS